MRTKEEILKSLFARTTLGIKLGLEKIRGACEELDNPQDSFRAIHVAGTNGKGSVCAYLESILRSQGYSTGLFTSPHIIRFEERFVINGIPVESEEWLHVYLDIEDIVNKYELTFFEISTLIAFELFKRKKIEWAVIETGLGGRLDSTNILKPEVSVVTNIGIDHIEYLGEDIIAITNEKLGIVKENIPLVLGIQKYSEVADMARTVCHKKNSFFVPININELSDVTTEEWGSSFTYNSIKIKNRLIGSYQIQNALCAIKTAEQLNIIKNESIPSGIEKTKMLARFQEVVIKENRFVFDVAHNIQATQEHCALLKQKFKDMPITIIAGIMADKNTEQMLKQYVSCADYLILIRPNTPRAAYPHNLIKEIPQEYLNKVKIAKDAGDAVSIAQNRTNNVISVTGSFYTVAEVVTALDIVL